MRVLVTVLLLGASLLLAAPGPAAAEQSRTFGDLTVHYNAMPTSQLTPRIARSYGLTRSRDRGMLMVTVRRADGSGAGSPVPVRVAATAVNLNSQLQRIPMREVRERQAVYYLGEYGLSVPTTMRFKVTVTPEPTGQPLSLEFSQRFYRGTPLTYDN